MSENINLEFYIVMILDKAVWKKQNLDIDLKA